MVSVRINATETGNKLQQNMAKILMNSSWGRNGLKFDLSHLKHRKYIYFFLSKFKTCNEHEGSYGDVIRTI